MRCSKYYFTPIFLGLSLLLLLIPGHHYELYIQGQYYTFLYPLILQVSTLFGKVIAWLSAAAFYQRVPTPIFTTACCYIYTALTNVFIPNSHWTIVLIPAIRYFCRSLLFVTAAFKVASAAERFSKTDGEKYKWLLHAFFALFFGLINCSYIIASFFNLYLTNRKLNVGNNLTTQSSDNYTRDDETCPGWTNSTTCYILYLKDQLVETTEVFPETQLDVQSSVNITIAYVLFGVVSGILVGCVTYSLVKFSLPSSSPRTKIMLHMIKDLKFVFLTPCMVYNGIINGYVFNDFILVSRAVFCGLYLIYNAW